MLDAAREEGERFDQPLDVRIGAAVGLEEEPAGGGGILPRELLGKLADEEKLALVIRKQGRGHSAASLLRMEVRPVVSSTTVSKAISGAGSALSWAET